MFRCCFFLRKTNKKNTS